MRALIIDSIPTKVSVSLAGGGSARTVMVGAKEAREIAAALIEHADYVDDPFKNPPPLMQSWEPGS